MRHASLPENDSKQQESIPYHDYEVFYPTRIQTSVANCTSDTRYPNRYQYTPTFATTEIFGDEEFVGTVQALAHLNPQPYQQPFLYETMDLSPRLAQNQNRDGRTMRGKSLANPAWSNSNNKGQPARKRQRYDDADSSLRRPVSGIGRVGYSTQSEAPSECCSSCPSGTVCTEPDCDVQKDIVVTCTSPQCEEPVCTEPCLRGAVGGRRCSLSEESLGSGDEFSCWENTAWTSQESRPVAAPGAPHLPSSSHQDFESKHETPQEVVPSSVPTTPSLAMNMETPYSDQAAFHTPQSSGYTMSQPENISGTSLHGAGMRFGDDLQMFSCNWLDCGQPMQDQFEWHRHFHQEHIDPQFTFNCPMPSDSCQVPLNSNPIDHLQLTHGFTFHETANGFACPAPNCLTDEMYCDPSMLHNHLDQMHAIPVQGELQCQVDHCNTLYQDPHQFFNHLNSEHNLPIPMTPIEDIELPSAPTSAVKENVEQPEHDNHLSCKWTTGNDHLCGEVFNSEEELQLHVKKAHLSSLNKQSGYFCKWQGCGRKQKMGDKEGFSQRGKLERHMASHTGFKDCVCPTCGKTFSALQSLTQHIRLHTGEKPWKCRYCPKSFPQQSACTVHERIHTQEKPLQCNICGKTFSESSNLAKHRKTHGERGSYECKICEKTFHRLDQLKRHQETHEKKAKKLGSAGGGVQEQADGGSVGPSEEGGAEVARGSVETVDKKGG